MSKLYVYQIQGLLEKPNKDIGGMRVMVCSKDFFDTVDVPVEIFEKETLDYLFSSNDHSTILWTSSYNDSAFDVCNRFGLKFHHFNVNPECPNTEICDFERKLYFNFLLDDKAGFDPYSDWKEIYETLTAPTVFISNKQKRLYEDIHGT